MSTLTPGERKLRAQLAANTRWSVPGARAAHSEKIREARLRSAEEHVDPDGTLSVAERRQLADNHLRAEMQRLAFRASRARRARKEAA